MGTPPRLGVLGGMGPLATADFMRKLVAATPAEHDADHIPAVVYSVPQIPDRVTPILHGRGESPVPAMIAGIRTLETAGAECIAIPCVTAHHWYDELAHAAQVPILHIAQATCATLKQRRTSGTVGLLATDATLRSGFFRTQLEASGYEVLVPPQQDMAQLLLPAISNVKRNELRRALDLLTEVIDHLLTRGVDAVVLGCSELPVALEQAQTEMAARCVDTLAALARACVSWSQQQRTA
ncbi:MAG: amino acid racemase [Gammaproteobacteria bacterium]|nr:MAG: amino acid racemase [Gammaproteobacteria bacterium]